MRESKRAMRSDARMGELPRGVVHGVDPGARPTLQLVGAGGEATVALCGAQVLRYRSRLGDVLWTASKPEFTATKPVRGGIPLVFPWFGDHPTDKKLPAHGFARTLDWQLAAAAEAPRVTLAVSDDERTRALWPHRFRLEFAIDLSRGLELALTVTNVDARPFTFEEALHTYFAVDDIDRASVHGLEGVPHTETATAPEVAWDTAAPLRFRAETDRVFHGSPDRLELRAPALQRRVTLTSEHARSAIVWNPWPTKTARLSQMVNDDWRRFCCIETANVQRNAIALAPANSHTLRLTITAATAPA
jgi:glucose-6-phosphate 1-epimerase